MSSPPPTLLPSGRTKWLWLAIAGALGLWLAVLLMLSGPEKEKPKTPFDSAGQTPRGFDVPVAEAFSRSRRAPLKSAKPLAPFPAMPDRGKSQ